MAVAISSVPEQDLQPGSKGEAVNSGCNSRRHAFTSVTSEPTGWHSSLFELSDNLLYYLLRPGIIPSALSASHVELP